MILLDFFEILLKFCRNFWKFHGNPLNLQISMNFRGCGKLRGAKPVEKRSAARFAHPLRGAEVLVAVRGPSPGVSGGREKKRVGQRDGGVDPGCPARPSEPCMRFRIVKTYVFAEPIYMNLTI